MNAKDIKEIKNEVEKMSSKGFSYYMKNMLLIILLVFGVYMLSNPNMIADPVSFFSQFNSSSLWGILVIFFVVGGIYQLGKGIYNQSKEQDAEEAYKKFKECEERKKEEVHNGLVDKRFEATTMISNKLKELVINLGADRVTLCEMHNGTNNLSGMPFIYLSMNAEEISPGYSYISDEFKNFNLAKFPFIANHFTEGSWIGSIEEIEAEDPYFAGKLKLTKAKHIAFMILRGKKHPIGILTVAYNEGNEDPLPPKAKVIAEMAQESQVITTLLDANN